MLAAHNSTANTFQVPVHRFDMFAFGYNQVTKALHMTLVSLTAPLFQLNIRYGTIVPGFLTRPYHLKDKLNRL